ncbi:MAG: S8/S53 family peptidase [Luteolibacter sp.]
MRAIPGNPGKKIRIGILDTGFDGRHLGIPAHLDDDPRGDAMLALRPEFDSCDQACQTGPLGPTRSGLTLGSGHGTGTIGVLAGKKIRIAENTKGVQSGVFELGAAPDATIIPVRIAPGPASLSTANLAYGIDYASRIKGCDVLSLSHGGSASMMWTDTVNAAYDRGTAIFAATGDYFPIPPYIAPVSWLNRTGIIVPSSTVYPAACRRVMGVAGVTETGKTYARPDYPRYWFNFFKPSQFTTGSFMRGSYGADGVRRSYINARESREDRNTDYVQTRRYNDLRANPISAYSPGIPWLHAAENENNTPSTVIDLDGAGTSAATPQAAAAAAHWLACHRKEIEADGGWNDWRKAESTYLAMTLSASRLNADTPVKENQKPNVYLGCGTLKAKNMLDISYQKALSIKGETLRAPYDGLTKGGGKSHRAGGHRGISMMETGVSLPPFSGETATVHRELRKSPSAPTSARYLHPISISTPNSKTVERNQCSTSISTCSSSSNSSLATTPSILPPKSPPIADSKNSFPSQTKHSSKKTHSTWPLAESSFPALTNESTLPSGPAPHGCLPTRLLRLQ